MALAVGTTLGPYEIVSALGAGGMGEVYKANDSRLDRIVAIKVLPSHLSDNAELKERFEREARAISSLNHPHICTLHDVGSENGVDFLVLEYLEGETLADRLQKGPLDLEEAFRYAIQIADALEVAHRQGVVHRDLKPGNIMLTAAGAKLLDFGLAKFQEREAVDAISALPTQQKPLTEKGTILGTFQYMAPEQLEGEDADARTDVFAFGALLFEMLTGRKAFEGKSQASLVAAILERDPPSITSLQPMSPPAADRVVRQCLAKDPDERWQTAGDLKRELEWIADVGADALSSTNAPPARVARGRLAFGVVGLLMGAMLAGLLAWNWSATPEPTITRFEVAFPESVRLTNTGRHAVALSPDGTQLVYSANQQLYLRSMDDMETTPIRGTEGARSPFFSPDGEWIGFHSNGKLRKVPVAGGAPVTLCDALSPYGASWGSDDTILFGQGRAGGIFRVPASGGERELLIEVNAIDREYAQSPEFLPGANAVLFTLLGGSGNWDEAQIVAQSLATGEREILVEGGADARYIATGHLVYALGESLFAVPFDLSRLEVTGGPVPVLEGVLRATPSTGAAQFALSSSGSLAYIPPDVGREDPRTLVWVDRQGVVEPVTTARRAYRSPRLSHAGDRLAVTIGPLFEADVWVLDLMRDTLTRLTFNSGETPIWTPDDQRVTYAKLTGVRAGINWKPVDGSGVEEALVAPDDPLLPMESMIPFSWSPDARTLVFRQRRESGTADDIGMLSMEGDRKPELLAETVFAEAHPVLSPDGRWLAYASDESGRREVYVRSFLEPGGRWQISTEGGTEPRWNPAGNELFYRRGDEMWAVSVATEPSLQPARPTLLFEGSFDPGGYFHNYDVSPDGQRFLMVQSEEAPEAAPDRVNVVLHWLDELERRVQ